MKCKDCKFWDDSEAVWSDDGRCRRNAPIVRISSDTSEDTSDAETPYSYWPISFDDDWCGEFKERNPQANLLELPIHTLNLSERAARSLDGEKINTLDDLVKRSKYDLLQIRGFGETCLNEVVRKLADIGLHLRYSTKAEKV